MTTASPTVRRRELAARLRKLRADAGLTVEQVAEQLMCSPAKVSRWRPLHSACSRATSATCVTGPAAHRAGL